MKSHLKQAHVNVCTDYNVHASCPVFSSNMPYDMGYEYYGHVSTNYNRRAFQISGVTPVTKHCKLIFAHNDIFYSCSEIKNGIFYSVLQYIGPAADAANYKYKLEFFNKERTENLAVTLLARSLNTDLNEVRNSGNCVVLHPELFNRFTNERSELAFSLEIFKG
jgi:hypothetical protein